MKKLVLIVFILLLGMNVQADEVLKGIAESTSPTEMNDGTVTNAWFDTFGRLLTYGSNPSVGAMDVNPVAQEPVGSGSINVIASTQLDNSPQSITSSAVFIGDKRKVSFITKAVETDPGGAVDPQVLWTVDLSFDGSTWYTTFDIIFDSTGTDSPVTGDTLNPGNGNTLYGYMYLPEGFTAQYARLVGTCGANCDADEYITVTGYLQYQK